MIYVNWEWSIQEVNCCNPVVSIDNKAYSMTLSIDNKERHIFVAIISLSKDENKLFIKIQFMRIIL